jgi:Flp pilus assembly protein TadD
MLLLPFMLAGCVWTADYPYSSSEERRLMAEVIGLQDKVDGAFLTQLDASYEAQLDALIDSRWSARKRLAVLRSFLFEADGQGIMYSRRATLTAMETLRTRSGNCLSMTNLFVASARYLGLSAQFQSVSVKPTWDQQGDLMIRYEHIVATGRLPGGERYVVDFLPEFNLGDFDWQPNSDAEAVSLYFNNLGAEQLVAGNSAAAIGLFQQALLQAPNDSDAWNNMGAALSRQNQDRLAEFSYLRSLRLNPQNLSSLNNLASFYAIRDLVDKAEAIAERVKRYRQRNPYYHYVAARLYFQRQHFDETLLLLNEAVRLKADEPDFYTALADTFERIGDSQKAEEMRLRAAYYQRESGHPEGDGNTRGFWIDSP